MFEYVLCGLESLFISFISQYHLASRGLVEQPDGNWFCDDDCKENVGL
jgi:hypothetical protein